jgi:hypothetical protein
MPSKQAETYTPGTADITITSGVYLSEDQTIKGDSNLTAENIKSGVSIFGVEGSFTSDATATASNIAEGKTAYVKGEKVTGTGIRFYKCTSVDTVNKTWTGYKAVLTDGIYSFEENATEGLIYGSGFSPVVGEIYNSKATIQVTRLYTGADPTLLFFAPLTKETDRAETGQLLAAAGTITYDEGFANITNNGNITTELNAEAENYTIAFWVKKGSFDNYNGFFTIDDGERQLFVDKYINDMRVQVYYSVFESLLSSRFTNAQWTHYAIVFSADKVSLYVDGELAAENDYDQQFVITQSCQLIIGKGDYRLGDCYMKDFRIYGSSKSRAEIEYIMELNRP